MSMSMFMTRVVLHGVDGHESEEYEQLHAAMARKGFSRTIEASDGRWYRLAPAEYYRTGDMTAEQVHADAKAAAASVWSAYSVFVTVASSFLWSNLQPAA